MKFETYKMTVSAESVTRTDQAVLNSNASENNELVAKTNITLCWTHPCLLHNM